ncbi:hypothetical protein N9V98_03150 [Luminiphilus sp.]|nr:hypothetical protein [Luminiphilus sp.]
MVFDRSDDPDRTATVAAALDMEYPLETRGLSQCGMALCGCADCCADGALDNFPFSDWHHWPPLAVIWGE